MKDVAIIGGGPVGLLLANLLGRRGHSVIVLEKQKTPYDLPRAIHFDGEAMRVFQAAGLADEIEGHTFPGKGMLFQDRDGQTLVDWSRDQEPGPMGWLESYRFHQPGVENVLRQGLERFDDVTLTMNAQVSWCDEINGGIALGLHNGGRVEAQFVVGADGAASFTRNRMQVGMRDLGFHERWLVVDLRLTRPREDLGDYSIQYCDPDAPATYVRGAGDHRRWEFRLGPDDPDRFTDAMVWDRLARWVTRDDGALDRHAVYVFRSRVARKWRAGRLMIAGDAAHQMPPFMGQGMCAGIRDVANLAWKLSRVSKGAHSGLLDSYQSEREPNTRAFIDMSVALGGLINQTAAGQAPQGRMASIWPDLGPGIGSAGMGGGMLMPQVRMADGRLADDAAGHDFYVLSAAPVEVSGWMVAVGAQDWLAKQGLVAAIMRPDGYCLTGVGDLGDLAGVLARSEGLRPGPVVQ